MGVKPLSVLLWALVGVSTAPRRFALGSGHPCGKRRSCAQELASKGDKVAQQAIGVMKVSLEGIWSNGRPVHTNWAVRFTATSNRPPACANVAARLLLDWGTIIVPLMANNYSISSAHFVDLDNLSGATGDVVANPGYTGGSSASMTPPNMGVMVRKAIGSTTRDARPGRVFMPGIAEGNIDEDGKVLQSVLDQVGVAFSQFLSSFNSAGIPDVAGQKLVVYHTPSVRKTITKSVMVPNPDGIGSADDITSFVPEPLGTGIDRRLKA